MKIRLIRLRCVQNGQVAMAPMRFCSELERDFCRPCGIRLLFCAQAQG